MRIIWEEEDIKPGTRIIRSSCKNIIADVGFAQTVSYIIGQRANGLAQIGMVNFLTDGMFFSYSSKKALMDRLNNDDYGYRLLTNKEINLMLQEG